MHIKLPESSKIFVFGSILTEAKSNDLDILVVYDSAVIPPEEAYRCHRKLFENFRRILGLPVDVTLLTYGEEARLRFVEEAQAKPIEDFIE